jgi:tRNA(adenine34) deaminase
MLSDTDHAWFAQAISEAKASGNDVPVGAIVVHDGKIIGRGHNEREEKCDPTAHAEIVALRKAAQKLGTWRLDGSILYTTLEPCAMCAEAIIQARVARLVFGAYDPLSGACGSAFNLFVQGRLYPLPEIFAGVRSDECKQMLVQFFQNRRSEK